MSEVSLKIGGRNYRVACSPGEEMQVERLGAIINDKLAGMGQLGTQDAQNLLFAALLLADELQESRAATSGGNGAGPSTAHDARVAELEGQLHSALAMRDELATRNAQMERDLREAAATQDESRRQLSQQRSTPADMNMADPAAAELAPALERFAEMLEKCADQLEGGAAAP